jgi:hypothetical protein
MPEYTRIRYKDYYISLKVTFWGVKNDSSRAKTSAINYRIVNFTDEVSAYKRCVLAQNKENKN